jgi:transposase
MDAIEQLKEDLREGRIDAHRLVDVIVTLQRELQSARQRIADLEKQLGGSPPPKVDEPFSLRAEAKRQEARSQKKPKAKRKGRRGRLTTADKVAQAERAVVVVPDGVAKSDCHLSHVRPVWRLENGRAVLIAYHIYRGPKNQYGKIPGVLGRSEFGLEIVVAIAYLVYVAGLSFDKVCLVFSFFQNLKLSKSQADALLRQLSRHWHNEFEVLCTLLANSLVVHTDETSWSLNSVWAFLSEKARLLFFGVHKDAATLKQILDPATFAGLVFSDDAAVYANFTKAQKCWAHLLRKAIKLTLQDPNNLAYRRFTDRLLEIYAAACHVQHDQRLRDAGRTRKIAALEDELLDLCGPMWFADLPPLEGPDNDYRLLVNEVMRLALAQELFTFVTAKAVEQPNGVTPPLGATNNAAERILRSPAEARKTGRTNKTLAGARRQTILTSVLESLRLYLPTFTLASVIAEIQGWIDQGRSCFTELLEKLKLPLPQQSVLDRVLPQPSG